MRNKMTCKTKRVLAKRPIKRIAITKKIIPPIIKGQCATKKSEPANKILVDNGKVAFKVLKKPINFGKTKIAMSREKRGVVIARVQMAVSANSRSTLIRLYCFVAHFPTVL